MFVPSFRWRRALAALAGAASLAGAAMFAPAGGSAAADPIADKKAEAERIASRVNELNTKLELLAEDYNAANIELQTIHARIAEQQARVAAMQAQLAQKQHEVREYAVEAYIRGGDVAATPVLLEGDATTFGRRSGYLSAAVDDRRDVIDELRASEEDVEVELAGLDTARGDAEAKQAELAARKAEAEAAMAEQRRLHDQAQGELAELVRAEQQRRAAEEAEAAARRAAEAERQRAASRPAPQRSSSSGSSGGSGGVADAPPPNDRAAVAVAAARAQIGDPYVWAADGPDSFDCSGLTQYAWAQAGVSLPHNSAMQYTATRRIEADQLAPGDLVFYGFSRIHHVAIYVGGGKIVHAPHAGDVVREDSLHYWDDLRGYGRVA